MKLEVGQRWRRISDTFNFIIQVLEVKNGGTGCEGRIIQVLKGHKMVFLNQKLFCAGFDTNGWKFLANQNLPEKI